MGKPKLYKVLGVGGKCCNGGHGKWHLPKGNRPGKWMPAIDGELEPCDNGYHLCRKKHLVKWLNTEIYEAEYRGEILRAHNKVVVREARLVRRVETWTARTARLFACDCAERSLKYADKMSVNTLISTIDTARRFANGDATREDLAAAGDAAWAAARAAAGAAARAAARDAAWAATWAAARDATWAAARDAARAAASDAEARWQTKRLFEYLDGKRK